MTISTKQTIEQPPQWEINCNKFIHEYKANLIKNKVKTLSNTLKTSGGFK